MRKCPSGASKRSKKRQLEKYVANQAGSILKHFKSLPSVLQVSQGREFSEELPSSTSAIESETSHEQYLDNNEEIQPIGEEHADIISNAEFNQSSPMESFTNSAVETRAEELDSLEDPGMWPEEISHNLRDTIVKLGVTPQKGIVYPRNESNRKFSEVYYTGILPNGEKYERKWLAYSKSKDSVFCIACKLFSKLKSRLSSGHSLWQTLSVNLRTHESSQDHKTSCLAWNELKRRIQNEATIDTIQQNQIIHEVQYWTNILSRVISITKFLGKKNLSFQGHNAKLFESSNGNFLGLVEMLAEFDPVIQEHVRKCTNNEINDHYLGTRIQNEVIDLIALRARETVVNNCKKSKYFSIILDCTRDVSKKEQLSIILRYFDLETSSVEEHFLGFVKVDGSTGEILTDVLLKQLEEFGLKIEDCRGQSYDNGANMRGVHSGVQRRILNLNSRAFFVPCNAHSLNLVVLDAAKSVTASISFFGVVQSIFNFFSGSGKRWDILLKHVESLTLKPLSDTRWESRVESLKCLKYEYVNVYDSLAEIANDSSFDSDTRFDADTLGKQLKKFKFMVQLSIWYDILFQVNLVSQKLQSPDLNILDAERSFRSLIEFFKEFRNRGLASCVLYAREIADEMEVEPSLVFEENIRQRRKKVQFSYEGRDEPIVDPDQKFRVEFFLAIVDQVLSSLSSRFEQLHEHCNAFGFLYNLKNAAQDQDTLLQNCKDLEICLSDGLNRDVKACELRDEINFMSNILREDSKPKNIVAHIIENKFQDSFPNLLIALRILLTIPVTVASAERSFSRLKLIKTYLRSTMSQERLAHLAILSIEHEIVHKIDISDLVRAFANAKARKVKFV